ncbi:hypothetical protein [Bacillus norwichensis]|uniref:CBS domain-containing protein n=1 Tax=Bacillus norwichensis TaxID=2762217 RepID=A0ABR8VL46_9BACI|nr:hypothetical protein [Bacillus norwichensis]MBD8005489.1 hypothetical protein [Bacillus norwichensis]
MVNIKLFNDYFLASHIAVPLLTVNNQDTHDIIRMFFETYNFNVVGFKEENKVIGYLDREQYDYNSNTIEESLISINTSDIVAANTPLVDIFALMEGKERLFLMSDSTIDLLITKADLQKPPVRMLLFGLVTLLESEMADVIRVHHPSGEWKNLLTEGRVKKIEALYEKRKEKNIEIDSIDCTQFADKKTVVLEDTSLRENLFTSSKKSAEKWMRKVELLRDDLAHAQSLTNWFETENTVLLVIEIQKMIHKLGLQKFEKIISK